MLDRQQKRLHVRITVFALVCVEQAIFPPLGLLQNLQMPHLLDANYKNL